MKDATKFHFLSNIYKTWVIGKNIFYEKLLWKKLNKSTIYGMNPWPLLDFNSLFSYILCLCSAFQGRHGSQGCQGLVLAKFGQPP